MNTFGQEAERLAKEVSDREEDLRIITNLKVSGGQFRLVVDCDHTDPAVTEAVRRVSDQDTLKLNLMSAITNIARLNVDKARAHLRDHVAASSKAEEAAR